MARPAPLRQLRRSPAERLAAWLYTGPLGHLWGTGVDVVSIWVRFGAARLRAGRRK